MLPKLGVMFWSEFMNFIDHDWPKRTWFLVTDLPGLTRIIDQNKIQEKMEFVFEDIKILNLSFEKMQ